MRRHKSCGLIIALVLIFLSVFVRLSSGKVADRIINTERLLKCGWSEGGESKRKFGCSSTHPGVQVSLSAWLYHFSTKTETPFSFGADEVNAKTNRLDISVEKSAVVTDYTCFVLDYCLSGAESRMSLSAYFHDDGNSSTSRIWSRQLKGDQTRSKECRELVQTIYDHKQLSDFADFSFDHYNISMRVDLFGIPSGYYFEHIDLYSGPCRVRIEHDYFREYEHLLTENYLGEVSTDSFYYYFDDDDDFQTASHLIGYRWPDGIVPYIISTLNSTASEDILRRSKILKAALTTIESISCIKFHELSPTSHPGGFVYLEVTDRDDECFTAEVGIRQRSLVLNLGDSSCWNLHVLMHQLMHVLAFGHETNRADRNFYVKIDDENVEPGKTAGFERHSDFDHLVVTLNMPYDYHSVMHFHSTEFSRNSTAGLKTVVALEDEYMHLGSDVFSEIDIAKIRTLYCSKAYKCLNDDCPTDSTCFDQNVGCQCMTQLHGSPGSCLAIMDQHLGTNCGASLASYGKVTEIGPSGNVLCLCTNDGQFSNSTCPIATNVSSVPFSDNAAKSVGFGHCQNQSQTGNVGYCVCPFGYRQLPNASQEHFICDPVPEVVLLHFVATSLLVPINLQAGESVTKLNELVFQYVDKWPAEFDNENSSFHLAATKIVRFEVLRALSLIFYANDSLVTKASGFDVASLRQEPWINPFGSVKISKPDATAGFDVSVILHFTRTISNDLAWLGHRFSNIFGMDGAQRENGFIFVRGKSSLSLSADVCQMFGRPDCGPDLTCHRGNSLGNITMCTTAESYAAVIITAAAPLSEASAPSADGGSDALGGLTILEISMIVVALLFGIVAVICMAFLIVSHNTRKYMLSKRVRHRNNCSDDHGEQMEMSHRHVGGGSSSSSGPANRNRSATSVANNGNDNELVSKTHSPSAVVVLSASSSNERPTLLPTEPTIAISPTPPSPMMAGLPSVAGPYDNKAFASNNGEDTPEEEEAGGFEPVAF